MDNEKEISQAFMSVLDGLNMQEKNIKAITQLLRGNFDGMDDVISFIKEDPCVTESEIIAYAVKVSKKLARDNPYRKALIGPLHSINAEITLEEKNMVLIVYKLDTEDKISRFNEWVKSHLIEGKLTVTESEIVRAAVQISKEK